ncbi:MAG: bifunctional phosphoribosyl-AMP cyclohydrolase/phosphoribosyl-ATP diphosphatase HisIE [Thermoplasmata archaeon]
MFDYDKTLEKINWGSSGLVPVVVKEDKGDVLTLAYLDRDAFRKTLDTGYAHYYSRSKKRIRMKGETSGNVQAIKNILLDCDHDAVLFVVEQKGDACHKGEKSCFFNELDGEVKEPSGGIDYSLQILKELEAVIRDRRENPVEGSYTCKLFEKGKEEIYKKMGEELIEILVAEDKESVTYESADLLYHMLVLLAFNDIELGEVMEELNCRRK